MLPRQHKLGSSTDFRRVTKKGARAGTRTVVVHYLARTGTDESSAASPAVFGGPRFGFVVSKQVGNAVTRHRVTRQLRHVVQASVDTLPRDVDIVVRALPPSAHATADQLHADLASALGRAAKKAGRR